MSNSGLIEIIADDGNAYLFGATGAEVPARSGSPIRFGSLNDWKAWLQQHFTVRFSEQQVRWENLLHQVTDTDQMAQVPNQTFKRVAQWLNNGAASALLVPAPDVPPTAAPATEGSSEARSRQPEGGGGADASGAPEAKDPSTADTGPADQDKQCVGDPVAPVTGEEILILEDFTVAAPMAMTWVRSYRSGYCDRDLGLGAGWTPDCLRRVWQDEEQIWVLDSQAKAIPLTRLNRGELTWQARAGLRLERRQDNRMVLTEADGRAWIMATVDDVTWYPVTVQNLQGHQWRFHYDARQRLSRIELAAERFLELAWVATGAGQPARIAQIWVKQGDQRSLVASYDYDSVGNLIASDSHHGRERYQYQGHLLTRRELPTGYGFTFDWQGQGPEARCLRAKGDEGHHDFRFDYQPDQYLTRVTDAFGNTQVFHYDDQGRITARQEPDGALYQWHYNDQGLLLAYQQPDDRTTRYAYDNYGRKVAEQQPDGREHHWRYNELGHCTWERLEDGREIQRLFDPLGRLLSATGPDGTQWQYHYDAKGWLNEATSDAGDVRRLGYGESGDLLALEQDGHLQRFAFNPEGRVAGRLEQDLVTEYDYQGAKLLAVHQYPEQAPEQRRSRQYYYDQVGRLTGYITATGDAHGYDYNTLARPIAYRRPDGHTVAYDYDLAERLTAITRADGQQWQLGWNARGQVERCAAPDGRDIRFHYNAAGDITRREQPGTWVQTLERDAAGRVLSQTSQGKDRKAVTRHFQYDANGRRSHASCADRKLSWQWNRHGQVTEHHQDQHRIGYHYGPGSRIEQIQLPDGTEVHYRYDRFGRWIDLTVNGNTLISRTLDNQGRETDRQAGANRQSQLHDRYGCLIKRRWQGQTPATRRYRWDAENRLEAALDSVTGDTHYQRDPQGQLTRENDTEYHYDLGGNRIPEGGQLRQDRLHQTATDKRDYDALGAEVRVTGKHSEHRQFDAEGQLIDVRKPGLRVSYGYDALGRRAWRKSEAGTTTYLWHNDVLLGEQTPEGQWQFYIRDPKTDEPLITLINGQAYYYELDHRMMPVRLWDQSGDILWQGNANAWGLCQPEMPKGHIHQPIRMPGQFEDELTGIVQNRFREYEPESGRYLTADPLGIKGGFNSYRYTRNPIDYVDPLGLAECDKNGIGPADAEGTEQAAVSENSTEMQELHPCGLFPSADDAARHASERINPISIEENLEYGGMVYRTSTGEYSYTTPIRGTIDGVNPGGPSSVPEGTEAVAYYHSHGAYEPYYDSENFSNEYDPVDGEWYGDIPYAKHHNIDGYVSTPEGSFKRYSVKNDEVSTLGKVSTKRSVDSDAN
ncbi:DUF4329 domain-containing protein [uncultured Marinobacter sp.]|uniref:DUF4329 domain-containing protein n=1 Tax=uncultured Marinobacter sp. TaxID=187379 RepID=UPI0030DA141D